MPNTYRRNQQSHNTLQVFVRWVDTIPSEQFLEVRPMRPKPRPIYRYLRELRDGTGLTVREAAQRIRMSYSYLNEIENGRKQPSADILLRIAKAYGAPPVEVLSRAGKITPEMLYPGIENNPEPGALRTRLKHALSDPLLEELATEKYPEFLTRMTEDEAWKTAVRDAEITLNNTYAVNYRGAIANETLRWAKSAGRRNRSTPDEAKNLIGELNWKYQRCQKMYRSLYQSFLHKDPPLDWV